MTELTERFESFFREVNGGVAPYPWQVALVERLACCGRWPDIGAPTGSGKSAVVEVHVFAVAAHRIGVMKVRPPRRLILVSPRRVLVDDQYDRAQRVARRLSDAVADPGDPLFEYAQALVSLQTQRREGSVTRVQAGGAGPQAQGEHHCAPLLAWSLRGGVLPESGWRLEPAACQVICTTPQMWGSRLLLRGYGASRASRNLEAGLLGHDAVAVIDEAHLHERLLDTARTIAEMSGGATALQVVAMTATQQPGGDQIGLGERDLLDRSLTERVQAPKRLELIEVEDWGRPVEEALIEWARAQRERVRGTVGVFVNEVPSALRVAVALRAHGQQVEVVCGRMRPADVAALRERRPGLLTAEGDPEVDFLVSTQSLEVGVDLDLPAMISVIAPASALAQRAGRLNRTGRHADASFAVIVPSKLGESERGAGMGPYASQELLAAREWLNRLGESIAPFVVAGLPLPPSERPLLPRLRAVELETFAMSSDAHGADPEPDLYLLDPTEARPEAFVIARAHLNGLDPAVVRAALRACPPRQHEQAPVPWTPAGARGTLLSRIIDAVGGDSWIVGERDGSLVVEAVHDTVTGETRHPRPGETLVVPAGSPICAVGVIGLGERFGKAEPLDDVLQCGSVRGARDWIVALPAIAVEPIVVEDPLLGSRAARASLAGLLEDRGHADLARRLRVHRRLSDLELTWCGGDLGAKEGLLVVRDMVAQAVQAPQITSDAPVLLDDHQRMVRERLQAILDALAVSDSELPKQALLSAARYHDEGKRHPRFQARMGALEQPLAKPLPGHRPDRGDGWRHEQLSAAYVAEALSRASASSVLSAEEQLAIALVAAHHGRGRPLFDRMATELLDRWQGCGDLVLQWADRLFGAAGEYELLRQQAQRRHGVHGLAWLEALVRCADMQVSKEGR